MKIFKKKNYGVINISSIDNKYIPIVPDGAWVKCDYCGKILYKKDLENNYFICNNCGSNFRLSAYDRLRFTCDEGSFIEFNKNMESNNPMNFPGYEKKLNKNKKARTLVTFLCVLISALSQAYVIQVFIQPANLLSSGFTGVAILIEKITSTYFGFSFSTSLGMIVLNVPVAILCYKNISPRFTLFSLLQVFLASLFLKVCQFQPLFNDILLNITFGGVSYGLMAVLVLRGNASTGGTDFIALYISNKKGKSIWEYVFVFNTLILMIFGSMFGWIHAGYSILFQFISTKTIDSFYHRYERVTLQITTKKSKEIVEAYIQYYRHGISCVEAIGGYSKQPMNLLHTVVSSYEVQDIIDLMKDVDPDLIVNVIKTENFYGGFYQQPIE